MRRGRKRLSLWHGHCHCAGAEEDPSLSLYSGFGSELQAATLDLAPAVRIAGMKILCVALRPAPAGYCIKNDNVTALEELRSQLTKTSFSAYYEDEDGKTIGGWVRQSFDPHPVTPHRTLPYGHAHPASQH